MTRKRKPKRKPLVSIIIPVHGRFDLLEKCLEAIPAAFGEITHEVIIVDNASPEESKPFYDKWKQYRIIRNNENVGFPKACNQGVNQSNAPLLFFLNSDVILNPDSGKLLVNRLDDPGIGICGMKLLFPLEDDNLQGPAGTVQHVGLSTNIRGHFYHHFSGWSADNPKVDGVQDVYAVTGAALMTRKSLFRELGKFFEGYGRGTFEDCDYSLAVRDLGYNVIVEPLAVGVHYTGATAREYGLGYDLQGNEILLRQRWLPKMMWTEWNVL